jgi:general secretion pathway protein K
MTSSERALPGLCSGSVALPPRIIFRRTPSGHRPGFALIAALWLLVIIAAAGLEVSLRARDRRLVAANLLESAQARAAAEGGLEHARALLERLLVDGERGSAEARPEEWLDPWRRPETLFRDTVALGEAKYRIQLRDVGTALHLNRATEDELRRLFSALDVDFGRADQIAQSIMDWREPGDAHRARGAKREYYLRTGSPVLPRNAPFQELSEILFVRSMTPEIYQRAKPFLTLHGSGQVNLNAAERPLLLALPGMTEEAVAVLERYRRQARRIGNLDELARELSPTARSILVESRPRLLPRVTTEVREVEVYSEGWGAGGQVRARVEGLLVRSGGRAHLVWRRGE